LPEVHCSHPELAVKAIGPDSTEPSADLLYCPISDNGMQWRSIVACSDDALLYAPCQIFNVQEAERKRIAAEVHDGLGQWLGHNKFEFERACDRLAANAPVEAAATFDALAPKISRAMDEVRRIAMNLRPSTLEDLGILATLSRFMREYRLACRSIEVNQAIDVREGDIPETLRLPLYRIVQEAPNSAAKHAAATRVTVRLWMQGENLRLVIEDNGVGFDLASTRAHGLRTTFGHAGMRDRVRLTGGTFYIETAHGAGVIMVNWNLGEAAFGAEFPPCKH
jgi:signal transduction histidine kinase